MLRSTNGVSVFRGGAGTGKSFVLRELVEQLRQSGRGVVVLAPQRQQVVEMDKAGFPTPTTVASFLTKGELADSAVIVVDEAGQIGGRQMLELVRLIHERHGRLVLSGDTRQHGAVEASVTCFAKIQCARSRLIFRLEERTFFILKPATNDAPSPCSWKLIRSDWCEIVADLLVKVVHWSNTSTTDHELGHHHLGHEQRRPRGHFPFHAARD